MGPAWWIALAVGLGGCAATKPRVREPSEAHLRPQAESSPPPSSRIRLQGPQLRAASKHQGALEIQSPKGWYFNQQAPTRIWVYFSEALGNRPQQVDAPEFASEPTSILRIPFEAHPPTAGPATLVVRVSSALCRESVCVPIEQELSLHVQVLEESKQ